MPDVILALSQKRSQLYRRKLKIEQDMQQQIKDINYEISVIDNAINTLNNAIADYLCPDCRGTGSVRKCDAAGQNGRNISNKTIRKCLIEKQRHFV